MHKKIFAFIELLSILFLSGIWLKCGLAFVLLASIIVAWLSAVAITRGTTGYMLLGAFLTTYYHKLVASIYHKPKGEQRK